VESLSDDFSRFGEVLNVTVPREKNSEANLGYAFIDFCIDTNPKVCYNPHHSSLPPCYLACVHAAASPRAICLRCNFSLVVCVRQASLLDIASQIPDADKKIKILSVLVSFSEALNRKDAALCISENMSDMTEGHAH
jgi:hypothetical protein